MKRSRLGGVILIVASLALVQVLAVLVYREVEDARRGADRPTFRFERLGGKVAGELSLVASDGSVRQLSDLRGRTVLLHFWATWCLPCRDELPGLLELGRELRAKGQLELVAVSLDSDWAAVRQFFQGRVPPEIVREPLGASKAEYDLTTLPDSYLLSADGSIRWRLGGARDWRSDAARAALLEASAK